MGNEIREEIRRRMEGVQKINTAIELRDELEEFAAGDVRMTEHRTEVTYDWKLPVATDAAFSSSMTYDQDENVITGAALRFSPDLLDDLPDRRLQERMEGLIEQTDPPGGTLWGTYIRGDAQITGPHILAPGGISEINPTEFVAWLPRLLKQYHKMFNAG